MSFDFRPNHIDRLIGVFNPLAMRNRMIARHQIALMTRQLDGAKSFNSSTIPRNSKSANSEVRGQLAPLRENVRDLIRNAPFAQKGLAVIVHGVVGWGIEASIRHPNPKQLQKILDLWKEWALDGGCSLDGKTDFSGLQRQVMQAVAADGEVISRDVFLNNSLRLQILEADFICDRDQGIYAGANSFVNGLVMDEYGRPSHFAIYERHPGDKGTIGLQAHLVPASDLIHTYRQDRPGQNRGISWFNSVAHPLKMLNELQWTQLMRLKLSAAITGVVTQEPSQLAPDQLKKQRQQDFELSPGTFTFLNHGETINFPNIPNPEGFGGTCKLTLQEIAAGLGITYEALAGDLSNVNFSSGRLGDLQFRANIEDWRWHMLVPRFLNPAFQRFIRFCELRGVDARQATVEWTPPARQMISPLDEINAAKNAMRSGLQSLPGALRELGLDPERHLTEISDSNALIDKLGLILDSDPRRTSNGQLQSPDSLAGLQELSK